MKNYQIIEATIDKKALMMRVYTEGGFLVQLERGTEFSISFTREDARRLCAVLEGVIRDPEIPE